MLQRIESGPSPQIEVSKKEFEDSLKAIIFVELIMMGAHPTEVNFELFERVAKNTYMIIEGTGGKSWMREWDAFTGEAAKIVLKLKGK